MERIVRVLRWLILMILLSTVGSSAAFAESPWTYRSSRDDMRNIDILTASNRSINCQEFAFPYSGCQYMFLNVRRKNGKVVDVYLVVEKGQILCHVTDCMGSLKFDGNSIDTLSLLPTEDYDSAVVFVKYYAAFYKNILKSRRVVIELPFYKEGSRQFTFDLSGLEFP